MAICIDGNFVCLGGGCFCQTPTGVEFSGEAVANEFIQVKSQAMGSSFGYVAGGVFDSPASDCTRILKYSFASPSSASQVGNINDNRTRNSSASSSTDGYSAGGYGPGIGLASRKCNIFKFPFSSDTGSSDIASLTVGRGALAGQTSTTHGYAAGGECSGFRNTIEKYPFTSDSNATDVSDLACAVTQMSSQSSSTSGYTTGGNASGPVDVDFIQKFPFSADSNASDVGELTAVMKQTGGHNSVENGYVTGGEPRPAPGQPPAFTSFCVIQKFPFTTDNPSTDVACLTTVLRNHSGSSSLEHGYTAGGYQASGGAPERCCITRFSFSSDSNAACVGNLGIEVAKGPMTSQQV